MTTDDDIIDVMLSADKCGSYDNWLTPGLVDTVGYASCIMSLSMR